MKPGIAFKRLRLLPAAMVVMAGLLAVKGADLVQTARAEAPAAQPSAADNTKPDARAEIAQQDVDADDDATTSAAEVDVLTSLSKRRAALDKEAKALKMRANLLAAAEKRVDAKIAGLKALKNQIQTLLGQRDESQKKQIASLVKVYSAMKPRDAARIFNTLNQAVLLDVAGSMKPDALGAIMAAMEPKQAQDLTVKLAGRFKLPAKPTPAATAPRPTAPAPQPVADTAAPLPAPPAGPAAAPARQADATTSPAAPPAGG